MDAVKRSITLIDLIASPTQAEYLTNAGYSLTYDNNIYRNVDGMTVALPTIGSALDTKECTISAVAIEGVFLSHLSNNYPFSSVKVVIRELDMNIDTGAVEAERTLFTGLVFQSAPAPLIGHLQIICRGWKYYTDTTAGVPCTEQCAWSALGARGCGATIVAEQHVVDSVDGVNLTIVGGFTDTTTSLFNKGYVEFCGSRLKIKFYESGSTLQLDKAPPSDWVGQTVSIYSGCDRLLSTCRTIYDSEDTFLGLGIAMVDYNPFYEGA